MGSTKKLLQADKTVYLIHLQFKYMYLNSKTKTGVQFNSLKNITNINFD